MVRRKIGNNLFSLFRTKKIQGNEGIQEEETGKGIHVGM